ncbi:hypothetical protein PTKIN_Ptkin09bG0187500 [Pterospermum kingtungense]
MGWILRNPEDTDGFVIYDNAEDYFTITMTHEGYFNRSRHGLEYMEGEVDYFDFYELIACDADVIEMCVNVPLSRYVSVFVSYETIAELGSHCHSSVVIEEITEDEVGQNVNMRDNRSTGLDIVVFRLGEDTNVPRAPDRTKAVDNDCDFRDSDYEFDDDDDDIMYEKSVHPNEDVGSEHIRGTSRGSWGVRVEDIVENDFEGDDNSE